MSQPNEPHPIGRIPFQARRLFAHEAMAVARVVHDAIRTSVVCEPAKIVGLAVVLYALGYENGSEPDATHREARLLFDTLRNEFEEPDMKLLQVLVTSIRANPREDALLDADTITTDSL